MNSVRIVLDDGSGQAYDRMLPGVFGQSDDIAPETERR